MPPAQPPPATTRLRTSAAMAFMRSTIRLMAGLCRTLHKYPAFSRPYPARSAPSFAIGRSGGRRRGCHPSCRRSDPSSGPSGPSCCRCPSFRLSSSSRSVRVRLGHEASAPRSLLPRIRRQVRVFAWHYAWTILLLAIVKFSAGLRGTARVSGLATALVASVSCLVPQASWLDSFGTAHHFHGAQTQRAHDGAGRQRDEDRRDAGGDQPTPIDGGADDEPAGAERQKHPSIAEIVASDMKPFAPQWHLSRGGRFGDGRHAASPSRSRLAVVAFAGGAAGIESFSDLVV